MILISIVAIFCFASPAFADGLSFSGDLSYNRDAYSYGPVLFLTVNFEYNREAWTIGGIFAPSLVLASGTDATDAAWTIYGGYYFLRGNRFQMAAMLAYTDYHTSWDGQVESEDYRAASLGVKLRIGNLTCLLLYGMANSYVYSGVDPGIDSTDVFFYMGDLKYSFQVTENLSVYADYRWTLFESAYTYTYIYSRPSRLAMVLGVCYTF